MNSKQATVAEVIERLKKLPQDAPVFVRPKYFGQLQQWEDAPVSVNGIAEMHPHNQPVNVTFLV